MNGTLYIVATPIGNLKDITLRALEVLRQVGLILAEDTRETSKLLAAHGISVPLNSYHQHSREAKVRDIIGRLRQGQELALVSDAGTPGINDPGGRLVAAVVRELPDAMIVPIPGPNAAVAALSVCGFPADRYSYLGFVPLKKGRRTFFSELVARPETQVFYESKHRISKTMGQLAEVLEQSGQSVRPVVVARELTKRFETVYRGTAADVLARLVGVEALGEFVVVVGPVR